MHKHQDRLDAALAEARRMTAEIHDATGSVNGYLVTPAEIASLVVARTVASRRGQVKAGVWRLHPKAMDIVEALRPLASHEAGMQSAGGDGTGIGWQLSDGHLRIADDSYRMSAAVPGIHSALPEVEVDDRQATETFRHHLETAGLDGEIVRRATAKTRRVQGGAWTAFDVEMDDPRLSHGGEIENLAHLPAAHARLRLAALAKMTAKVRDNAPRLSRLADAVEASAAARAAAVEGTGMVVGRPWLTHIAHDRHRGIDDLVTMRVPIDTLTPGLLPTRVNAFFQCPLGLIHPTEDTMDHIVEHHRQRAAWLARHGGLRIEATGMAILRAAGCDVDAMVAVARAAPFEVTPKGAAAYVRIDQGRLLATAPLGRDVTWRRDLVDMPGTLPETVMAALRGRTVRSVVDHPALEGAIVSRCQRKGRRTLLHVEPRWEIAR